RQRQVERQLRESEHELDEALHPAVDAATEIARGDADQRANGSGDQHHHQGDGERDARPDNAAREDVAAELVGTEQVEGMTLRGAEEMDVGRDEPQEAIGIAGNEEAEISGIGLVGTGQRLEGDGVELARQLDDRIDVGQQAEAALRRLEADRIGRRERDVLRVGVHRGEEVAEDRNDNHADDQHEADHADDRTAEAPPDQGKITLVAAGKAAPNDRRLVGDGLGGGRRHGALGIRRQRDGGADRGPGHALAPSRMRGSSSASSRSEMMLPTISVDARTSMKVAVTQTSPTPSEPTMAGPTVARPKTIATPSPPVSM